MSVCLSYYLASLWILLCARFVIESSLSKCRLLHYSLNLPAQTLTASRAAMLGRQTCLTWRESTSLQSVLSEEISILKLILNGNSRN